MFKRKCLLLWLILFMLVPASSVYAVSVVYNGNDQICYNTTTGKYEGDTACGHSTVYKTMKIGGQTVEAYCSQFTKTIGNCGDFVLKSNSALGVTPEQRFIAGKAIELTKKKYSNRNEAYLYASELVNYIFQFNGRKAEFVKNNSELRSIYEEAVKYFSDKNGTAKYKGKAASELPAITIKNANSISLNTVSKSTDSTAVFVSDLVEISGLVSNYGGGSGTNNGDTTYTITGKTESGATVQFCENATGTKNCVNSKTLSKPSSSTYKFYVKVSGNKSAIDLSKDVTITVKGSNKSDYPVSYLYQSATKASTCQTLVVSNSNLTYARNKSVVLSLDLPSDSYTIKVRKVDTDGNAISGSTLSLYRADSNGNKVTNGDLNLTGSGTVFTYTDSNPATDFWNYQYCVKETKEPNGFVLDTKPACVKFDRSGKTCYNSEGNKVQDASYCDAKFECSDNGYSYEGGQCVLRETATPTSQYVCSNNEVVDSAEAWCAAGEPDESGVCASGELRDGQCYSHPTQKPVCAEGFNLSDDETTCSKSTTNDHYVCKAGNTTIDNDYCANASSYTLVTRSGNTATIRFVNERTHVSISKKAATGDDEVPGATLKICSNKPDASGKCNVVTLEQKGLRCPSDSSSDNSDAASQNMTNCTNKGTDDREVSLSWVSSDIPVVWEGLKAGTYYLVEDTPPRGYISVTTASEFTINADGSVKVGSKTLVKNDDKDNRIVVINNELTKMSVSKQDIATSKEVPGATISICESDKDENGNIVMVKDDLGECSIVALANGDLATWVSGNEPHNINGLPAGTYFLVERIAPKGYGTAESIIFTMKPDGTLVDKDGKSLKDSKIIMHDKKIGDVKTGMFGVYFLIAVLLMSVAGGVGSYFFLKKKKVNEV